MLKREYDYGDSMLELFNQELSSNKSFKTITFQVTDSCNLRCTYCYQINKATHSMSFDTAKTFINYLFEHRLDKNFILSEDKCNGLIIDFIGGEPLLEVQLIRQIIEYFEEQFTKFPECPWGFFHRYSICTNGINYFNKDFQNLLNDYGAMISVSVTVDGYKELHDSCRKFPNGEGSYDLAIAAALDLKERKMSNGTKITVSPSNISYIFKGLQNMITLGFYYVNINCVFEEGWTLKDAQILYEQLKLTANWLYENDLQDKVFITFFNPENFTPKLQESTEKNWCGCAEHMCALDYRGILYPCLRFMESSLGNDAKPFKIGTADKGFFNTPEEKENEKILKAVAQGAARLKQEEKCNNCPIGSGCSWCTAYNYQRYGDLTHRTTFICDTHKAAALACKYFYLLTKDKKSYDEIKITKELALDIISEKEWEELQWKGE